MRTLTVVFSLLLFTGIITEINPVAGQVFLWSMVALWIFAAADRRHRRDVEGRRDRERVELHLHLKESDRAE